MSEYFKCTQCKCKRQASEYDTYKGQRRKTCNVCKSNREKYNNPTEKKEKKEKKQIPKKEENDIYEIIKKLQKQIETLENKVEALENKPYLELQQEEPQQAQEEPPAITYKEINNLDYDEIMDRIDVIDFDKIDRPHPESIKANIKQFLKKINAQYEKSDLDKATYSIAEQYEDKLEKIKEKEQEEREDKEEKEKKEKETRREMINTINEMYDECISDEMTNKKDIAKKINKETGYTYEEINHILEKKPKHANAKKEIERKTKKKIEKKTKKETKKKVKVEVPQEAPPQPQQEDSDSDDDDDELTYDEKENMWKMLKNSYYKFKKEYGKSEAIIKVSNSTTTDIENVRDCVHMFDNEDDNDSDDDDDDENDQRDNEEDDESDVETYSDSDIMQAIEEQSKKKDKNKKVKKEDEENINNLDLTYEQKEQKWNSIKHMYFNIEFDAKVDDDDIAHELSLQAHMHIDFVIDLIDLFA